MVQMSVYSDSEIKCGYPLMNVQQVDDKVQPIASYAIFFAKNAMKCCSYVKLLQTLLQL